MFNYRNEVATIRTLVELFDECQIENVISALRYEPEKIIYVGYKSVITKTRKEALENFFLMKGVNAAVEYEIISGDDYDGILEKLNNIIDRNEDCYFDITGGKEVILAAIGAVSASRNVPMLKMNVRTGDFLIISGDGELSEAQMPALTIEEMVVLNGGEVIMSRGEYYEKELANGFADDLELIWRACRPACGEWNRETAAIKHIEQLGSVNSKLVVRSDIRSISKEQRKEYLHNAVFRRLIANGLICDFSEKDGLVTFRYKNGRVRSCIAKAGNILEFYTYMLLKEIAKENPGYYDDVGIGVVVDWDGKINSAGVSIDTKNEIDLIVMRDAVPIFISCKNGDVKKEALYELDTVARHFGGAYARKVLLSTYVSPYEGSKKYLMQRARDMKTDIIESVDRMKRDDFKKTLMKIIK